MDRRSVMSIESALGSQGVWILSSKGWVPIERVMVARIIATRWPEDQVALAAVRHLHRGDPLSITPGVRLLAAR